MHKTLLATTVWDNTVSAHSRSGLWLHHHTTTVFSVSAWPDKPTKKRSPVSRFLPSMNGKKVAHTTGLAPRRRFLKWTTTELERSIYDGVVLYGGGGDDDDERRFRAPTLLWSVEMSICREKLHPLLLPSGHPLALSATPQTHLPTCSNRLFCRW